MIDLSLWYFSNSRMLYELDVDETLLRSCIKRIDHEDNASWKLNRTATGKTTPWRSFKKAKTRRHLVPESLTLDRRLMWLEEKVIKNYILFRISICCKNFTRKKFPITIITGESNKMNQSTRINLIWSVVEEKDPKPPPSTPTPIPLDGDSAMFVAIPDFL